MGEVRNEAIWKNEGNLTERSQLAGKWLSFHGDRGSETGVSRG